MKYNPNTQLVVVATKKLSYELQLEIGSVIRNFIKDREKDYPFTSGMSCIPMFDVIEQALIDNAVEAFRHSDVNPDFIENYAHNYEVKLKWALGLHDNPDYDSDKK